ncbi:hypothetical protein [Cupriavidus sp. D39]|uniref:hypothetical protein n=1 Tax=Cupriavidus sp. D39 TaxID=2997877 RepID=UPI00226FEC7E|nr:hypothetical protein [Cupriavidus sp. D39]MCY0858725.1 hypothetical protein [Cupriavidus sp. D39]
MKQTNMARNGSHRGDRFTLPVARQTQRGPSVQCLYRLALSACLLTASPGMMAATASAGLQIRVQIVQTNDLCAGETLRIRSDASVRVVCGGEQFVSVEASTNRTVQVMRATPVFYNFGATSATTNQAGLGRIPDLSRASPQVTASSDTAMVRGIDVQNTREFKDDAVVMLVTF